MWIVNAIAKARNEEAAVTAQRLIVVEGNKELKRLGINSVTGF